MGPVNLLVMPGANLKRQKREGFSEIETKMQISR
jgi:hypothetical protein